MTKSVRDQATARAITRTELARVLADPDTSTADPERADVATLIRSGLVLVVDLTCKVVLAVIEMNPQARDRTPVGDDLSEAPRVEIRRRPVPDRLTPAPSFPPPTGVEAAPSTVIAGVNNAPRAPVARPTPAASPVRKPAPTPALTSSRVLDGVHPAIAAGVREELKRRGLDFRHVVVHGPTNVEIR